MHIWNIFINRLTHILSNKLVLKRISPLDDERWTMCIRSYFSKSMFDQGNLLCEARLKLKDIYWIIKATYDILHLNGNRFDKN